MSPRRKVGWTPKLSWHGARACGRVRIPGKGTVYLGAAGCWPDRKAPPPPEVEEEYRREVAQWLRYRGEDGQGTAPEPGLSVAALGLAFLRHAERWYRKRGQPTSAVRAYKLAVRHLVRLHGTLPAAEFRPAHLRAVRESMEAGGSLNRDTINRTLGRIRRMFSWAVEEELVPEEVWLRLTTVRGLEKGRTTAAEPGEVPPVPQEIVEATLPHLPFPVADMVRVQHLSGMRPEEVCGMTLSTLQQDGDLLKYCVVDDWNKLAHKDRKRVVYLGPRAQAVLAPYLENAQKRPDKALWIVPRSGRVYSPRQYRWTIQQACQRHGIASWAPNQLRHARASAMRPLFGIEGVQAELGHSSVQTSQVYAERLEALARKMAREQG